MPRTEPAHVSFEIELGDGLCHDAIKQEDCLCEREPVKRGVHKDQSHRAALALWKERTGR